MASDYTVSDIFGVFEKLPPSSTVHVSITITVSSSRESNETQDERTGCGQLGQLLTRTFNLDELEWLVNDIGVPYENLRGTTLEMKVRELISYFERRGQLRDLVHTLQQKRPNIKWPKLEKEFLQ